MMKNLLSLAVVMLLAFNVDAQNKTQEKAGSGKVHYSVFWGLIKSKEDPNEKNKTKEQAGFRIRDQFDSTPIDTTKYEEKSILWGAVKWTERKNKANSTNTFKNEQ
jgi:hypothetical protein